MFIIYVAVLFCVSFAGAEDMEQCYTLLKPETFHLACCHGFGMLGPSKSDECRMSAEKSGESSEESWNCEFDQCLLNKLSLLHANGSINEEATAAKLTEMAEEESKKLASERVMAKCLDRKYMKYAPKHVCEAAKFYICGFIQISLECPKWAEKPECQSVKELTISCKSFLDTALDQLALDEEE